MLANDLKKGMRIRLRNGWWATIEDNMRGLTRLATVEGYATEMGSIYVHEIAIVEPPGGGVEYVEFTPAQAKKVAAIKAAGF